jgi:hypothetical protein
MPQFKKTMFLVSRAVAEFTEFIDPDWGDKFNSGIGLSYQPAMLHGLATRIFFTRIHCC